MQSILKGLGVIVVMFFIIATNVNAQQLAYYQPSFLSAVGMRDVAGYMRCHPEGYDISKVEILFFDNRPVGSTTPFLIDGKQYGTVNFTNSNVYRWVTVASGTIPCSGSRANWSWTFFPGAGGQSISTYYSSTFDSINDPNKPIIVATRGTTTAGIASTFSSNGYLIAGAYYFNVPSTTVNVTVNGGSGGSSGTTSISTEFDDSLNFALLFGIAIVAIMFIIRILAPLYVRK